MINGIDFHNFEVQKYWTFPSGYKKDSKTETREMIFSGQYCGSRKMDGACFRFVKNDDGSMELLGRSKSVSGDYLDKIDWVPQLNEFFESLPNGTCLLGELYFPNNEGSKNVTTIIGCLEQKARERQAVGDKLHFYVFDVLAYEGEIIYKMPIVKRIEYLNSISSNFAYYPYVEYAKYYEGKELWTELQSILTAGGEGIVITKKTGEYQPGKRTARHSLKIKKELQDTIDCFFTGRATPPTRLYSGKEIEKWTLWENTRTGEKITGQHWRDYYEGGTIEPVTKPYFNGWAGSLEIGVLTEEGKIKPIGYLSGLTDEMKANPEVMKGKCIEVTCMEIMYEDGKFSGLRHAKLLNMRPDLSIKDCTWNKFIGE